MWIDLAIDLMTVIALVNLTLYIAPLYFYAGVNQVNMPI
jgi:hypothetical protein